MTRAEETTGWDAAGHASEPIKRRAQRNDPSPSRGRTGQPSRFELPARGERHAMSELAEHFEQLVEAFARKVGALMIEVATQKKRADEAEARVAELVANLADKTVALGCAVVALRDAKANVKPDALWCLDKIDAILADPMCQAAGDAVDASKGVKP
jgi:hypothetical protein